jgi:peptidoglycan/xylan/chitin deacetylase (PgdA/CDA1 family)
VTVPGPRGPVSPRFVVSGPARPAVALTFHTNGPVPLVEQLFTLLDGRGVVVTAFVVGTWLDANPMWAARLTEAGHELANHTWSHPSLSKLDGASVADEIDRCRDALLRLSGTGGRWFRPSGVTDGTALPSDLILEHAAQAGYGWVSGFDVDPRDYDDPGAPLVAQRTLDVVVAGSVISLHTGHAGTVAALPDILDGLEQRGLQPVRLTDLVPT